MRGPGFTLGRGRARAREREEGKSRTRAQESGGWWGAFTRGKRKGERVRQSRRMGERGGH